MKDYRNLVAHGNRSFNTYVSPVLPKMQLLNLSCGMISESEYLSGIGQNDLFAIILSIFILIDDKFILRNFCNDLLYTLSPYKSTTIAGKSIFSTLNLPDDILNRLEHSIAIK